jgi:ketosteroid isomerase-like protein
MSQMTDATAQELEQLSTNWATAELEGDTAFIEQLLADDFVGIGPRGFMLTKEQWLDRLKSGDLTYESFSWDELQTRTYGDAAIVIGRETSKGTYKSCSLISWPILDIYTQTCEHSAMKLSPYARQVGMSYKTAWR